MLVRAAVFFFFFFVVVFFFFFFFFFESILYKMGSLPFVYCSPPNRTLGNMTSFSHSYMRSYLEFRPPESDYVVDKPVHVLDNKRFARVFTASVNTLR